MIFLIIIQSYFIPCGCEDNDKARINILSQAFLQTTVTPCSVSLQNTCAISGLEDKEKQDGDTDCTKLS